MTPDTSGPAAAPVPATPTVRRARTVTLAALLALVALGLAWELWLAPTGSGTLALKVVPLALGIAGVWRHRLYTYRWLSLLVWLYFTEAVVRVTTESGVSQALAGVQLVLCLVLFGVCALYVRWRLRDGRLAAAAAAAPDPVPAGDGRAASR